MTRLSTNMITELQTQIICRFADGQSFQQIADHFGLSLPQTVALMRTGCRDASISGGYTSFKKRLFYIREWQLENDPSFQ